MIIFSSYLMYIMVFEIKFFCFYCISLVICFLFLFILVLIGCNWEDIGQLIFIVIIVGMIIIVGIFVVYVLIYSFVVEKLGVFGVMIIFILIKVVLVEYLIKVGVKMYGVYWCSYCQDQKQLFGKEVVSKFNYIECDFKG